MKMLQKSQVQLQFFLILFVSTLSTSMSDSGGGNSIGVHQQDPSDPFSCRDEFGYYPHPSDCSLYYVCVFGGALLESCSGGLLYSSTLQTCDWPRNVQCPGGNETLVLAPVEKESQLSSPPTSSTPDELYLAHNPQQIEDFPQSRSSRSYAGAQPHSRNYGEQLRVGIPIGRRVNKRQVWRDIDMNSGEPPESGYPDPVVSSGQVRPKRYQRYKGKQMATEETQTPLPDQRVTNDYYYDESDDSEDKNKDDQNEPQTSIASKLVQVDPVGSRDDEYEESSDYISQRYAANISNKVEPRGQQGQQQPPPPETNVKDYEYYYDYQDVDQEQILAKMSTTTTTPAPPPPPISHIRHHITQRPEAPPRRRPGIKPTLLPPSTAILKGASSKQTRNIFLDPLPSRPDPVYATPEPNEPATKCSRTACVVPDCNCGGKENPGGLDPSNTPQLVILTFDDSVNDLNKNLYKDLFEVGRKNPNGCPISATFYVSHEWTDYSQVQNLAADGHEIASHSISHSFGEQFSTSKWTKEVNGQREILAAYGGVKLNSVRGMRAPFLAIGGNNMFKMLYDANFTYDSSMPVYENNPPSWPYTLDYKIFHQCMIPPCPTKSYPGVWEVPMVMWQDLKGGRCSMGDACSNPPTAQGVYEMLVKNFERHYTTNRAPFGLYYHAAWFTQAHHKEGFESFLDVLVSMEDVWLVTNWQALQWIRNPVGLNEGVLTFPPFDCTTQEYKANLPKRCTSSRVCNLWHKSGVRYMKTCQNCPEVYPWTGSTGI